MNIILVFGSLILLGYLVGRVFDTIGIPKIIAYILIGVIFGPHTIDVLPTTILDDSSTLLSLCLAVITFEVGGELKWEKLKARSKAILGVTIMASLLPFILIAGVFVLIGFLFPDFFCLQGRLEVIAFSIFLAALSSPTDPTVTLAVIHQFNFEGKVKDIILGVAALDDALGIILFSLTTAFVLFISGSFGNSGGDIGHHLMSIVIAIGIGGLMALVMSFLFKQLKVVSEGQWIIVVFASISITYGLAMYLNADALLSSLFLGLILTNICPRSKIGFTVVQRYTEEFVFLIFFLLSGMHLELSSLESALPFIAIFVVLRTIGKYWGANWGSRLAKLEPEVRNKIGGGLIAQGGIVIGMALLLTQDSRFDAVSGTILSVIMGATIVHEIIGPITAKRSLLKSK